MADCSVRVYVYIYLRELWSWWCSVCKMRCSECFVLVRV